MSRSRSIPFAPLAAAAITAAAGLASTAFARPQPAAEAQPLEGRVIAEVRFQGLARTPEQFVANQIRSIAGRPLEWATIREDLRRLERLGEFSSIRAEVFPDPASQGAILIFTVDEAPIVNDIVVVGNRQLSDDRIAEVVNSTVRLVAGVPVDEYRISQARRAIEDLYRVEGFYQVQVTIDREELERDGIVTFRVREGERVKVTEIRFTGNNAFEDRKLRPELTTKTAAIFQKGPLDPDLLDQDQIALANFYRDRGYLDVRVSRDLRLAPDNKQVIVTFIIDEGPLYTLGDVAFLDNQGNPDALAVFTPDQLLALMPMKRGDAFSARETRDMRDKVRDAYFSMGYVDARVDLRERRVPGTNVIDMELFIVEGERFRTGLVSVVGNDITQARVVHRTLDIRPEQYLDATKVERGKRELLGTRIFAAPGIETFGPRITIQPEDPDYPGYRDVLVEVEETNTSRLGFGASVNSDLGLAGTIELSSWNFNIFDTPDSFSEFIRGRAFRGAGQNFTLLLSPGTETSVYSIDISDPHAFDTDYSLGGSAYFRQRIYRQYDEDRIGARLRVARRFGTQWVGALGFRGESITIDDIDRDAPVDLYEVQGDSIITSISGSLTRTTVDNRFRPTTGTRTELGVEHVGLFGGDYDFTKLTAEHTVFIPIDEDYLGRRTVVSVKVGSAYIPQEDEAPVIERLFLGGRTFRGFDFRGIGPRGIKNNTGTLGDDHVGGDFSFFAGIELEKPLWKDILAGVVFVDSGTVNDDLSFDEYRVTAGLGARFYFPQLGQAPLALDFAIPLIDYEGDDTKIFSFSIDIPF
ncbi:MAG: outer membrane protein assembly factor BamA [Phycisphaerales bacterium]|nr:outer membrane protein assembly factor BamA [Phycisphaerales bacterium]